MFTKIRFLFLEFISFFIPNKSIRRKFMMNNAFDFREKLNALKKTEKYLSFYSVKFISGGWNIGFIIDNKYVFKIRKKTNLKMDLTKIKNEKEITDIFKNSLSVEIPNIEIIKSDKEYKFIRYNYIIGKNLNTISESKIKKHKDTLSKQLANIIYEMHKVRVKTNKNIYHNDLCNNIIVNPKTMKITGIIDWEYAGPGTDENEFKNLVLFKRKIRDANIKELTIKYYKKLF